MKLESDKVRCLAAVLAVDAGRPVSLESLIAKLWDDDPPAKARATAHSYLSRFRAALRLAQPADADTPLAAVSRKAHTYTLNIEPQRIDWVRYVQLSRRARSLAEIGDDHEALSVFGHAEDIWQGEPLAGLPGQWAHATRSTMHDQWLATTLARFEVELRFGRFISLVPELAALADQRPTDERVAGHLITALYGCGRQAEALGVFQRTRQELRSQLGTEPGEQLSLLQQRVLRRIPVNELLPRPRGAVQRGQARAQPKPQRSYLPVHRELVGRQRELEEVLSTAGPDSSGGAIAVVSGMAGSGKSHLAVTAAHLSQHRFSEGQFYVDLRANAGAQQPLQPELAATTILRQAGFAAATIPSDRDELLSRCRELLAERRAVVVLDDARGPDQVRPLLPGTPTALILITSRHRLAELPCHPIFLDDLPMDDAVDLFTRLVGSGRTGSREEVESIVGLCAGLPLAIGLAASRLRSRPSWSLHHYINRLSRKGGRLDELRHGLDSVALTFDVSYQALPSAQQEAFRRLGLYSGPDIGPNSAAALIGRPLSETDRILEDLHNLHLIQEHSPERYVLHDLLREYAVDLVTAEERQSSIRRLVSHAIQGAYRSDHIVNPRRLRLPLPTDSEHSATTATVDPIDWPDEKAIKSWLITELPGLAAVEEHARTTGMAEEAAWLAHSLAGHLESEGLWREAIEMHCAASTHWRTHGVRPSESHALLALASVQVRAGQYLDAARAAERALSLARSEGDTRCTAEALEKLAAIHWHQSDLATALSIQCEVIGIHRSTHDDWNHARCLNNIGAIFLHLGDNKSALESFTEAQALIAHLKDARLELQILSNIGGIHLSSRRPEPARIAFERILSIGMSVLSSDDLATVRVNLAASLPLPKETVRATELYQSALHTFRESGNRRTEADAMNGLGSVHRQSGRFDAAAEQHSLALELAQAIGAQREQAAALRGLGQAAYSAGNALAACDYLGRAAALARQIGAMEEETYACETLAELHLRFEHHDRSREAAERAVELLASINAPESIKLREVLTVLDQLTGRN
ncbi:BTAD domain-containing putative transcriptional regulator [Kitasatospora sp. NPDC052868]|uniref:AfsR/SARP family transcriptional regulator n=1 Tax=Kitasatospora sp. NPDC052868 TaxID=3364060 RepID=UPI0037C986D0